MSNPVAAHDQALAYIRIDSKTQVIDGNLSYETLALEFETYWRTIIGTEVASRHRLSTGLLEPPDPIIVTIWKMDNK